MLGSSMVASVTQGLLPHLLIVRPPPILHRVGGLSMSGGIEDLSLEKSEAMSKAKASLLDSLLDNQALSAAGLAQVDALEASAPPVPGDVVWWLGRYKLRSTAEASAALQAAGLPAVDGFPLVTVSGDGGKELSIDLGALQLAGTVQHGLLPGDDVGLLRATLDAAEGLPDKASARAKTFRPVFVDAEMTLLRETAKEEPLVLVLSRLPPSDEDVLNAGFEIDDDYGA